VKPRPGNPDRGPADHIHHDDGGKATAGVSGLRFGWAAILDVPGLSAGDRELYAALLAHRNERTGQCNPSLGALARRLGITRRTVMRRLERLEVAGAIARDRHAADRQPADYELLVWSDTSLPPSRCDGATTQSGDGGVPRDTDDPPARDAGVTRLGTLVSPEHANRTRERNTRSNSRAQPSRAITPAGFDDFWKLYPRRVARARAESAYGKAVSNGTTPAAIASGLSEWCAFWSADGTEAKFIPYPTTFLSQERWSDAPPPIRTGSSAHTSAAQRSQEVLRRRIRGST
jgi:hypothetical protein